MTQNSRTTMVEAELTKGTYTIICECSNSNKKYKTEFIASVYYPRKYELILKEENQLVKRRAYLDMICGTTIQNGEKEILVKNQDVRRYTFRSEKLQLLVYVYTNNTREKYSVLEQLEVSGEYECNMELENKQIQFYLPPLCKKAVIFLLKRSPDGITEVDIVDHVMKAVK